MITPKCICPPILKVDMEQPLTDSSVLLDIPVYSDLLFTDNGESVTLHSSQSLLLNTTRLENACGYDVTKKIVDKAIRGLTAQQPSYKSNLPSDFDFESIIRSRNIQSPSELKSWIEYNQSLIDRYNQHAKTKKSWRSWFAAQNKKGSESSKTD